MRTNTHMRRIDAEMTDTSTRSGNQHCVRSQGIVVRDSGGGQDPEGQRGHHAGRLASRGRGAAQASAPQRCQGAAAH